MLWKYFDNSLQKWCDFFMNSEVFNFRNATLGAQPPLLRYQLSGGGWPEVHEARATLLLDVCAEATNFRRVHERPGHSEERRPKAAAIHASVWSPATANGDEHRENLDHSHRNSVVFQLRAEEVKTVETINQRYAYVIIAGICLLLCKWLF